MEPSEIWYQDSETVQETSQPEPIEEKQELPACSPECEARFKALEARLEEQADSIQDLYRRNNIVKEHRLAQRSRYLQMKQQLDTLVNKVDRVQLSVAGGRHEELDQREEDSSIEMHLQELAPPGILKQPETKPARETSALTELFQSIEGRSSQSSEKIDRLLNLVHKSVNRIDQINSSSLKSTSLAFKSQSLTLSQTMQPGELLQMDSNPVAKKNRAAWPFIESLMVGIAGKQWQSLSHGEKTAVLSFESRFDQDPQYQHDWLRRAYELFAKHDANLDGLLEKSELGHFLRALHLDSKGGALPVGLCLEDVLGQAYDCYDAFNEAYDGVAIDDILEVNQLISHKAKAQR